MRCLLDASGKLLIAAWMLLNCPEPSAATTSFCAFTIEKQHKRYKKRQDILIFIESQILK